MLIEIIVEGRVIAITNQLSTCSEVVREIHHGLSYKVIRESGQVIAAGIANGNDPEYCVIH